MVWLSAIQFQSHITSSTVHQGLVARLSLREAPAPPTPARSITLPAQSRQAQPDNHGKRRRKAEGNHRCRQRTAALTAQTYMQRRRRWQRSGQRQAAGGAKVRQGNVVVNVENIGQLVAPHVCQGALRNVLEAANFSLRVHDYWKRALAECPSEFLHRHDGFIEKLLCVLVRHSYGKAK